MASPETRLALRNIPLFAGLADDDVDRLASRLIEREFRRGASIMEEGLEGDSMYLIREGRVKVTKISEDGREKILEMLGEGDFVGEMALVDDAPRSASVTAITAVRLFALSRADFLATVRHSPELALMVIRELSMRLRVLNDLASSLSFSPVEARVRALFVRLATEPAPAGRLQTPPLTHQQLADMVGTSRETVTRALKSLREGGWLVHERKRYSIPREE
jgi:CRP/FNR family transcriptional regulator